MLDELLKDKGLKYEDLNPVERETLHTWMEALQKSQITPERVKEYIGTMRDAVENELTKIGHESKQDIYLKARLRNYMLLDAFLTSPEKAKQQLERVLASIAGPKIK